MDEARWTEQLFADDMVVVTRTRDEMTHALQKLFGMTRQWGLTVSVPKSKMMVVRCVKKPNQCYSLMTCQRFQVLVHRSSSREEDVKDWIAKASFGAPGMSEQGSLHPHDVQGRVYRRVVLSTYWTQPIYTSGESLASRTGNNLYRNITSSKICEWLAMKEKVEDVG